MGFKKRGAIYSVIALMLCVAVYLNWNYSKPENGRTVSGENERENKIIGQSVLVDSTSAQDELETLETVQPNNATGAADYFAQARLSRQKARDEAVGILNSTIENNNTDDEARTAANASIQLMAGFAQAEANIESLVMAKGYADCVVFMNDGNINVIVASPAEGLTQVDTARIRDIVLSESKLTADQIKIIPQE